MSLQFLDTNILLRHLRQDHPTLSPKATAILTKIEKGELKVRITDIVIFETVFTLQRTYKQPKTKIAEALLPLVELPNIKLPGKRSYRKVFSLYLSTPLGFADCYHAVFMQRVGIKEILSFDSEFDKIPGIKRQET